LYPEPFTKLARYAFDSKPKKNGSSHSKSRETKDVSNQAAIAMELPFVLVAAVVSAGSGYFSTLAAHKPWLLLLFAGLVFTLACGMSSAALGTAITKSS